MQPAAVRREIPFAIVGPPKAVHDVREVIGVRQSDRVSELVQCGQIKDDALGEGIVDGVIAPVTASTRGRVSP